ncbi:unnamed protein product [Acanthosepion pharaonis]|uniref:ZP domain-containing protein n=1 Tax=Acanthosepion pharaonis TaxID=158019 RepID=A0A812B877_ACAPH|nr:unnamed protein product [Sepia pharaonis]
MLFLWKCEIHVFLCKLSICSVCLSVCLFLSFFLLLSPHPSLLFLEILFLKILLLSLSLSLSLSLFIHLSIYQFLPYCKILSVAIRPPLSHVFNGSFAVEFAVKSGENFFQKYDRIYTLQCRIHNPQESAFITSNLNNEYYPPKDVPIKMTLVPVNPTELSDGQVKLGEKVKLKIEILKKLRVQHGRVTLCFVQDSLHENITHTFYRNKCPIESFPEPIKFMTNKTNPHLIESTGFKAFQFYDNGNVQFTCYVELCTKEKDPYCLVSGCVPRGTFMHPYTKVKTSIHIDTSGAINQISFILMPAIAIMITIFTKINMF